MSALVFNLKRVMSWYSALTAGVRLYYWDGHASPEAWRDPLFGALARQLSEEKFVVAKMAILWPR